MSATKARALDAVGGSDVAAIRGENPYMTALQVWRRMVLGELPPKAGLAADIGTVAEEPIICDWCERNNIPRERVERNLEVCDPKDERKRGELDGHLRASELAQRHGLILDSKLVLSPGVFRQWGEEHTDQMPVHILNQQAWYCMIAERAGYDVSGAEVIAVIGGEPRRYFYKRVPEYEALIDDDITRFLTDYVDTRKPPPAQTVDDALWFAPHPKSDIRPATDAERELVAAWRETRGKINALDARLELAKARVCEAIGASEGLWLGGDDRVTWKANKNGVRSLKG